MGSCFWINGIWIIFCVQRKLNIFRILFDWDPRSRKAHHFESISLEQFHLIKYQGSLINCYLANDVHISKHLTQKKVSDKGESDRERKWYKDYEEESERKRKRKRMREMAQTNNYSENEMKNNMQYRYMRSGYIFICSNFYHFLARYSCASFGNGLLWSLFETVHVRNLLRISTFYCWFSWHT